jgi:PTH2 family peptidyl-tRNA hydrolase
MPAGKLAAQAGHAFLDAYLACRDADPERAARYHTAGHGTKVLLLAPTLDTLYRVAEQATRAGLPHALITDAGHVLRPHFTGAPMVTALGLGPIVRQEAPALLRRLSLG